MSWTYYILVPRRRQNRKKHFVLAGEGLGMDSIPSRLRRATVSSMGDQAILLSGYSPAKQPKRVDALTTSLLEEAILHTAFSKKWAVDCQYVADGGSAITEAIRTGMAIAVSDGSFKDMFGTAALVIKGEDSDNRVLAVNVTPGDPEDQSSYCSKLSGIFGVVTLVNLICEVFSISSGEITSGCNGIEALKSSFVTSAKYDADLSKADYDLVSAICSALVTSPVSWKYHHVKGHQDNDGVSTLDRWATLNVEMDNLAKAYWAEQAPEGPSRNIELDGEYWPLCI